MSKGVRVFSLKKTKEGETNMGNSNKDKGQKKEARIKELRKELVVNDTLYKKNKEQYKTQVQFALYKRGLPQGSPVYDKLLEIKQLELEEEKIKNRSDFTVVNPIFHFQTNKRWVEIQQLFSDKKVEALEANIKEIEVQVSEVEVEIVAQNGRIEERRIGIVEELKELGNDVTDIEKPNYIG